MYNKKWYQKNPTIILMIIIFFPLGLYLMWKYSNWSPKTKSIVTSTLVIFIFILVNTDQSERRVVNNSSNSVQNQIEIPAYSVLNKTEHISTRMSDDQASYFGGVLIEADIMSMPPEEFIEIARAIADTEDLKQSASFYLTEESFRADFGVYVPEENQDLIERAGGIESNQEYIPQAEIDKLRHEGYIGRLKDGEFTMSPSSAYYDNHNTGYEF